MSEQGRDREGGGSDGLAKARRSVSLAKPNDDLAKEVSTLQRVIIWRLGLPF